jgi:uncharacterized membrane protein
MRLRLTADVGGVGALGGARIRLPLYLDVANATARLADASCSRSGGGTATIATRPGIVDAWIGEVAADMTDFRSALRVGKSSLVEVGPVKVRALAHVEAANTSDTQLAFDQRDIDTRTIKRSDTRDIAASLVSSLVGDLTVEVQMAGFGLSLPGGIQDALAASLSAVAKPLDAVVHSLLDLLGVHLGEADVRVNGLRCTGSGLLAG